MIYVTWVKYMHSFRRKTECSYIHSSIQKKKVEKYLKNKAAEQYLEPCPISMMEHFCENTTAKTFIMDVWYGSEYTLRLCKILKSIWSEWIRKCWRKFLQCGPCRGYLYVGISQDIRIKTAQKMKFSIEDFFSKCD